MKSCGFGVSACLGRSCRAQTPKQSCPASGAPPESGTNTSSSLKASPGLQKEASSPRELPQPLGHTGHDFQPRTGSADSQCHDLAHVRAMEKNTVCESYVRTLLTRASGRAHRSTLNLGMEPRIKLVLKEATSFSRGS